MGSVRCLGYGREGDVGVNFSSIVLPRPGHFGDNNLEQQLLALIFGRILILLKHQLQCIYVYVIAIRVWGSRQRQGTEALERG